ncbi:SIS domain-containing protein [Candidatus Dependentiae bacterium]
MSEYLLWPKKFREGVKLAKDFFENNSEILSEKLSRVVITGIGGSGIAGKIVSMISSRNGCTKVLASDPFDIPVDLGRGDLLVLVSHSGNTWEILDVLDRVVGCGANLCAITVGGILAEKACKAGAWVLNTPKTGATPREELGRFVGILLSLIDNLGFVEIANLIDDLNTHIERVVEVFSDKREYSDFLEIDFENRDLHIFGVSGDTFWAAYRAQTQFNENSKIRAVFSGLPEAHHNLIEGFGENSKPAAALVFTTEFLDKKLAYAVDKFCDIVRENNTQLYRPRVLGDNWCNQLISHVIWPDFASYNLGIKLGVDVRRVEVIGKLRRSVKKVCGG